MMANVKWTSHWWHQGEQWRHLAVLLWTWLLLCSWMESFRKHSQLSVAPQNTHKSCGKLQQASFLSPFHRLMKSSLCQEGKKKINQRIYDLVLKCCQSWGKAHAQHVFHAQFVLICKGTSAIFLSPLHYAIQPDVTAIYFWFIWVLRMNSFFCIYLCLVEAVIYRTELGGGGLAWVSWA